MNVHLSMFCLLLAFWSICANNEALIKPTSTLYMFDNDHTIKFEENLDAYYARANLLYNNTLLLEALCAQNQNLPNCVYYAQNLKNIAVKAQKEKQYIQQKRHKRELLCILLTGIILNLTVSSLIAGLYAGMAIESDAQTKIANQINLQTNTTNSHLNIDLDTLNLLNHSYYVENEADIAFRENLAAIEYMHSLVDTTMMAAEVHNQATIKFINILGNNLREQFFSIIDIYTFNKTFHSIQHSPILSDLHPKDILELCSLGSEILNDTITVYVYLPIINSNKYFLVTMIPIPITRISSISIIDSDAKYILETNTTILEIPAQTLAQCAQAANLAICHSSFQDEFLPIDNCTKAIITNKRTEFYCAFKQLQYKNQLIKISDKSFYAHIINPILLKISCGSTYNIMNITHSSEIFHQKNCHVFKQNIANFQQLNVTTVKIDSEFTAPDYAVFENKTWSNIQIFRNMRNERLKGIIKNLNTLTSNFNERSQVIKVIEQDPFSFIWNFFKNIIETIKRYIVASVLIFMSIILILFILCYFGCKRRR